MPRARPGGWSQRALTLWAKANQPDETWLPLTAHLRDAAEMARRLWDHWLPQGTRGIIADGLGLGSDDSLRAARRLLVFLAFAHDLGKATPAFQSRCEWLRGGVADSGLSFPDLREPRLIPHPLASQAILRRLGFDLSAAVVAGGHHGSPPNDADLDRVASHKQHIGFKDRDWLAVQDELAAFAADFAGEELAVLREARLSVPAQVILSGLVIMSDWLASNVELFPYLSSSRFATGPAGARADLAWALLNATAPWDIPGEGLMSAEIFRRRFADRLTDLRPLQKLIAEEFPGIERPGIAVIEAPMGEGKTEAALAAAEIFAGRTGRGGLFFALPTQAMSDGIFPRLKEWLKRLDGGGAPHGLLLAHGKAGFNDEYRGLPARKIRLDDGLDPEDAEAEGVVAHEWFSGRKKGMLADFAVGTVDQILMAGLAQRHLALRHLGLANKVAVIDECHAYDAYMSQYLCKVLRWLGAYGVPVIVLSATLPGEKRREIIREYLGRRLAEEPAASGWAENRGYPVVTFSDGGQVRQLQTEGGRPPLPVALETLTEEELVSRVDERLRDGGCAGVIVNTVKRAQKLARMLAERLGGDAVRLLHSRFLAGDRLERETSIRKMLGPPGSGGGRPGKLVVVGTQVIEQSLDVDFDVLFSDLCPMDLLLQRLGRLHRHDRPRPPGLAAARCFVLGLEDGEVFKGSARVYGEWPLLAAREILRERRELLLPDDIAGLVNRAYAEGGFRPPAEQAERFAEARRGYAERMDAQRAKAKGFQICDPVGSVDDLTGWLSFPFPDDAGGKRGEATVRDADPSLEVIVIEQRRDGSFGLLPWLSGGAELPAARLDEDLAAAVARCTLPLPRKFSAPWKVWETIAALEDDNRRRLPRDWGRSGWLRGELFLILEATDGRLSARLGDRLLVYDREYGLTVVDGEG